MTAGQRKLWWMALVAGSLVAVGTVASRTSRGQEAGPIGRLLKFGKSGGGASSASAADPSGGYSATLKSSGLIMPQGPGAAVGNGSAGTTNSKGSSLAQPNSAGQRITPQPRNAPAATEADPLITTTAVLRSDNGQKFGMFMQVFVDGTVIDGEGVHKLPRAAIKPLVDAIQASDALRQHGHCGGPPTDYVEETHVIVYERSFGRLKANTFSFSGNIAGCDHSIKHLRDALDGLQRKLSGAPAAAAAASGAQPSGLAPLTPPTARTLEPAPLDSPSSIPISKLD